MNSKYVIEAVPGNAIGVQQFLEKRDFSIYFHAMLICKESEKFKLK